VNLFLHYAFDAWMARTYPDIPFERYADDIVCHCRSAKQAQALWSSLGVRFTACKLTLHPQKTKLVYCKDTTRRGEFPNQTFDFLGYAFRPREAIWRGDKHAVAFLPAASPKALKAIRQTIRRWSLHRRSDLIRWARNKHKRVRPQPKGARDWLARIHRANPALFAHWRVLHVNGRTSGAM